MKTFATCLICQNIFVMRAQAEIPGEPQRLSSGFTSVSQLPGYADAQAALADAKLSSRAEYYVSPGEDLQKAVSRLKAGDTLFLTPGTYKTAIDFKSSGTADAAITIEGIGNVTFDIDPSKGGGVAIDTAGQDYIHFKNLAVNGARRGIEIDSGSTHITVDRLRTQGSQFAVWMKDASFIKVSNASVKSARNGFRAEGTTHDVSFDNIDVTQSREDHVQPDGFVNGDGFIFEDDTYNLTFRNIHTSYNSDAGMDIKGDNVLIENLISHHNTNGLKLWGKNVVVRNALIYSQRDQHSPTGRYTGAVGINVRAGQIRVYDSTIYDNAQVDVKPTFGAALHVENSIIARSRPGDLYTALGSFTFKNIAWYRQAKAQPDFPIPGGSLWTDPQFIDPAAGNFRRTSGAAADRGFTYFSGAAKPGPPPVETPVPAEPPAKPVPEAPAPSSPAVVNFSAQKYVSVSGTVFKYKPGVLTVYGNRSIHYRVTAGQTGSYTLRLETAQISRARVPAPDYRFHFQIYVDGVLTAKKSLPAERIFKGSSISLGLLSAGSHSVTIKWVNDRRISAAVDANLGLRNFSLIRN